MKWYLGFYFVLFNLAFMPLNSAIAAEESEGEKPDESPSDSIELPVLRKIKRVTQFTPDEKTLDQIWFKKKAELARTFLFTKRKEMANLYAQELNQLTDDELAFLSTQSYLWTDIIGQEPQAFAILSPSKLRILSDTIINRDLIRLEKNLPLYLTKLISTLDIGDPQLFEKLEAFLPGSVESGIIEDEVAKKARAYRQKRSFQKDEENVKIANIFLKKLERARKMRLERIMETALEPKPVKEKLKVPEIKPSIEPETPPVIEEPVPTKVKTIEADENWRETKPDFVAWLNSDDFDISRFDRNVIDDNLRFILKQFSVEDEETKEKMRNAFVKTVAQSSEINKLFTFLHDMGDDKDLSVFMALLQGKAAQGTEGDPYLIELLWRAEKGLIIAGKSVRDLQALRLTELFKNLDENQMKISLTSEDFWKLIEDQPKAAVAGLKIDHFKQIAQYFLDNIKKDKFKPAGFAKYVVAAFQTDTDIDHVYGSLLALAPLSRFIAAIETTISLKLIQVGMALKRKYGLKEGNAMMQVLRAAMK